MTPKQREKLTAWIEAKHKQGAYNCPMCGEDEWNVKMIATSLPYSEGNIKLGGDTLPVVPFICANCGYVWFLSAIISGLISE
ncbi:MAG TPA: hypothetical protein VJU86_08850 [Pyrinomonadaceae bacterium]|nr:hypothetical protein [Pyrinomonadaceae bacterium]